MAQKPQNQDDYQFLWFTVLLFIFIASTRIERALRTGSSIRYVIAAVSGLTVSIIVYLGMRWREKNLKTLKEQK